MARSKHLLRKVTPPAQRAMDDQVWIVNVALAVLGAFVAGSISAYLRFDEPRWFANAWTWLISVPIVCGGLMLLLRRLNTRQVRRTVQLATILTILIHVILFVASIDWKVFGVSLAKRDPRSPTRSRPTVRLPDYHPHHFVAPEERPKQDYEKPVETVTPEPDRMEVRPDASAEPPPKIEEQPVRVPESPEKSRPDIVQRQAPNAPRPRSGDSASQLSRQSAKLTPTSGVPVDVPRTDERTDAPMVSNEPQARSSPVQQQNADPVSAERLASVEPAAKPHPQASLSRTATEVAQPQTTASPTAKRQVAQPTRTPQSPAVLSENPATSRETSPEAIRPQTVATEKLATTSPEASRAAAEIAPQATNQPADMVQRREQPAEPRATLAQTPIPSSSQRPRITPEIPSVTVAPVASERAVSTAMEAQASRVQRTSTETARPVNPAPATPDDRVAAIPSPAAARREPDTAPVKIVLQQSAAVARQAPAKNRATAETQVTASQVPANQAPSAASTAAAIAAANASARKQDTANPEVGKAIGDPTPISAPTVDRTNLSAAGRQENQRPAPVASTNPGGAGRTNLPSTANVPTAVADVPTNRAPQPTADAQPSATVAQVRQQTTVAPNVAPTMSATADPSASPQTQVNALAAVRSENSDAVRLPNPTGNVAGPARATRVADVVASARAVENPAAAVGSAPTAETTSQPAPVALSRSQEGIAGSGRSANLDQQPAGARSPAFVASGAARRTEATQTTLPGPSLSPSAPAVVGRSTAGADRPSTPFRADAVEVATAAGSREPNPLSASASASKLTASADARRDSLSAASGNLQVDLGPTRVVSEPGNGRAAGGGRPETSPQTPASSPGKSPSRSGPTTSLAATAAAELPAAPAGSETGSAASRREPAVNSALRSVAGGERVLSSGPTIVARTGVVDELGTTPQRSEMALSRADLASGGLGAAAQGTSAAREAPAAELAPQLARNAAGGGPVVAAQPTKIASGSDSPTAESGSVSQPAAPIGPNPGTTAIARGGGESRSASAASPIAAAQDGQPGRVEEVAVALRVPRAESVDAPLGRAVPGGGSPGTARSSAGPSLAANTKAENITLAGGSESAGTKNGVPLEAQGLASERFAGGVAGLPDKRAVGAAVGDTNVNATSPSPTPAGPAVGERNSGPAGTAGLRNLADATAGSVRKSESTTLPGRDGEGLVEIPKLAPELAQAAADHGLTPTQGTVARASPGGAVLDIAAREGPAGLGDEIAPQVGIDRRVIPTEETEIRLRETRFTRSQAGGVPKQSSARVAATDSYRRRIRVRKRDDQSDENDVAIERGLAYLARQQRSDGSWTLTVSNESALLQSDSAATGLAVLAFQGANYNHRQDKYQDQVRMGLDYLVRNQRENGDLFVPADDQSNQSVWLYSHSIAALALCEAYGMTQDPALRDPAQRAINFITTAQHKDRGGWRYAPGVGADTSVSGWMTMALESGKRAGLDVQSDTYANITRWLDASQASANERYLYRYNPWAADSPQQRHGRATSKTMTAVGLLMRLYSGWKPDHPDFVRGSDYLAANPPGYGTLNDRQRDTYYWYYATQVMLQRGGERWETWREQLFPLLRDTQIKQGAQAGSWDPLRPVPDKWAEHAGRIYVTTLNLLSLEVKNRSFSLYEQ